MGNNEKREKTIYDKSLFKIFFWSGFPMFMILLFACVVISGIVFLYRRSDPEGVKIIIFCLAVLIPFSYGIPFISLLKAWKQQYKIGVYWKDRTDYHLPEWQREWYLTYDRGGFILCHRNYIKQIIGCREETEIAEHARGKVYYVVFEDIDGKNHTLKFSCEFLVQEFQRWFEKPPYKKENDTLLEV